MSPPTLPVLLLFFSAVAPVVRQKEITLRFGTSRPSCCHPSGTTTVFFHSSTSFFFFFCNSSFIVCFLSSKSTSSAEVLSYRSSRAPLVIFGFRFIMAKSCPYLQFMYSITSWSSWYSSSCFARITAYFSIFATSVVFYLFTTTNLLRPS